MTKNLVIVESPAKARTLSRILGKAYRVEASYGHVRDLPEKAGDIPKRIKKESWARLGVDVEHDFEPLYIIPKDKKKHIQRLKKALAGADALLLATDEDREGESISWHVVEVLQPQVPAQRIVFHEITEEAILAALEHPRPIDGDLVEAQESRRIIDRLYGYQLSPLLWKKVRGGLSAGRVQSVAVRLCVLRERERSSFVSSTFWGVEAELEKDGQRFTAQLARVDGQSLASSSSFDPDTGELKPRSRSLWLQSEEEVRRLIDGWERPWRVTSVEKKPAKRRPAPPFITSTLQQEANRKLRFTARHTMSVAQRLYEGMDIGSDRVGLITYMRTDSVALSNKALGEAGRLIGEIYGEEYYGGPRRYASKSPGAQEAHEAIRPTDLSRRPEDVRHILRSDEHRLYELIWKRTVASQMADARLLRTAVEIEAPGDPAATFTARGTAIRFPGFLRAYVEGSDDPSAEIADREVLLPELDEGEGLDPGRVDAKSTQTQPPARFTEASLVKKLEAEGIGRPSTYASIIDTIQERGYIFKQRNALVPTFTALAVTQILEKHFREYVDTRFTAQLEDQLDAIAEGDLDRETHLRRFWFGEGKDGIGLQERIDTEEPSIDFPAMELGEFPDSGKPVVAKIGRYGPYVQTEDADGGKLNASIPEDVPPADFGLEQAVELLRKSNVGPHELGTDPETGQPVLLQHGRYGPYVQLGEMPERGSGAPKPKRASLPQGVEEKDVTLAMALEWLSLPRSLGEDPETGEEVIATRGRYGPYVKRGKETRSLEESDDVYAIDLGRARELLAQPKGRGRGRSKKKVLQEFEIEGRKNKIQLLDGRYGPYLTDGELNASLPKNMKPEQVDAEEATRLLSERGKPPKRKRRKARKS